MPKPKIIAFYLPQYHPIPQNDEWWGKGFTDWTNVAKGKPRFCGHYQPHLPADLGFYDLRQEETRVAQAELANQYGITGFCYYHYWFNEKMLLERPFDEVLETGSPDFPFCLCWANENWTRRWDGLEQEILMEQNYNEYEAEKHMQWLVKAFNDKRYIRVGEKPIFLIYNIGSIPNLSNKVIKWRELAKKNGLPGLFLCSVKSVHNKFSDAEVINFGFDAIVDFKPDNEVLNYLRISAFPRYYFNSVYNKLISIFKLETKVKKLPVTFVADYKSMVNDLIKRKNTIYKTLPCIIPGWDNSARKKNSVSLQNDDVEIYKKWLDSAIEMTRIYPEDEQIVFINAWNEWAEGCHLEPDLRNGRKFLEATLQVVKTSMK